MVYLKNQNRGLLKLKLQIMNSFSNQKNTSSNGMEAAKDCGISNNSALKYALDNGRHFVKRRSDKNIFYVTSESIILLE